MTTPRKPARHRESSVRAHETVSFLGGSVDSRSNGSDRDPATRSVCEDPKFVGVMHRHVARRSAPCRLAHQVKVDG
jgi:hypothetical protein